MIFTFQTKLIFTFQINSYFSNSYSKLSTCVILILFTVEQNIIHYVSKDLLFNDYIFGLGYYLVLQPDGSHECVYPSFDTSILNNENDSDSKMAHAFTHAYELVYHITEEY